MEASGKDFEKFLRQLSNEAWVLVVITDSGGLQTVSINYKVVNSASHSDRRQEARVC